MVRPRLIAQFSCPFLTTLGFVVLLKAPTNQEDKIVIENSYLKQIDELLQKLYVSPSMSVYSEIASLANQLEWSSTGSYIPEKLSSLREEAHMLATRKYARGFNFEIIKTNLNGYVWAINSDLKHRQSLGL